MHGFWFYFLLRDTAHTVLYMWLFRSVVLDVQSVVWVTYSINYAFYIRSAVSFIQSVVHDFSRSVVFDVQPVFCFQSFENAIFLISCVRYSISCMFHSISCICDFFDQLCFIQSVVHVNFSITCMWYSIGCVSHSISCVSFNQLYMWLFRSVAFDIRSVVFDIRSVDSFIIQLHFVEYK